MASPALHEIKLLIETDDPSVVERLAEAVGRLACPQDDPSPEHECPLPWFVISSEVEDPEAWRDLLNR